MSGTKRKKRSVRKKRARSLGGIESVVAPTKMDKGEIGAGQLGIGLATLAGANLIGATLLGKHVFLPGVLIGIIGVVKKNLYWTMAGAGMALAGGLPNPEGQEEGKEITEKFKDRVKSYLNNFSEKLYLSKPETEAPAVNGFNGGEEVNYFLNPYSQVGAVDTSDLDKLQMKIDSINSSAQVGEIDVTERNF